MLVTSCFATHLQFPFSKYTTLLSTSTAWPCHCFCSARCHFYHFWLHFPIASKYAEQSQCTLLMHYYCFPACFVCIFFISTFFFVLYFISFWMRFNFIVDGVTIGYRVHMTWAGNYNWHFNCQHFTAFLFWLLRYVCSASTNYLETLFRLDAIPCH